MKEKSRFNVIRDALSSDDSHLYPIQGKFNATREAIQTCLKFECEYGTMDNYEFEASIDHYVSSIVNNDEYIERIYEGETLSDIIWNLYLDNNN